MREPPKGSWAGKTLGHGGPDQPVSGHDGRYRHPRKAVTSPPGQRHGIRHGESTAEARRESGGSTASIVARVTDAP
ncbi:hypothetical protein GCM10010250_35450 [Streptomyces althioticus]|nr:hypothetical protein GCM10010250_35450 [Streptomyces althioticus]